MRSNEIHLRRRPFRKVRKLAIRLLVLLVLLVAGYIAYLFMTYHRLPDTSEQHSSRTQNTVGAGETYTVMTWNLGFGAYNRDFSFFMDGGAESRARSQQHVYDNLIHCISLVNREGADFALFQEVDRRADRSWRVDEAEVIRDVLGDYQSYYAQNYNSPYLLFPITRPHGAAKSGILTFANKDIFSSERRSLPVDTTWRKLLDLDRCYSVCRIPAQDGHALCLFNLHLSAYTADGSITTQQLEMLLNHMKSEYELGNYVIAGGDFNKDLPGNAEAVFGVSGEGLNWAQPLDTSLIPEGLQLLDSQDPDHPIPTCRNCDTGYIPGQTFVVVVDGFIVSDNIEAIECRVIDDDFQCSDHNPVVLRFRLRGDENESQTTEEPTHELGSEQTVPGL